MRGAYAITAILLLIANPALARPEDDSRALARQHITDGKRAFEIGAYDDAIRAYGAAYRLVGDPALLFNLAQANRLAHHNLEALRLYRTYLEKEPGTANRADIQRRIDSLTLALEQERSPRGTEVAKATPRQEPAAPPPPVAERREATRPMPIDHGRSLKTAGAIVGSVGLAAAGLGVGFGLLAKNASDRLMSAADGGSRFDADLYRAGERYQIVEGVLFGIGGAAVVSGVVMLALGAHRRDSQGTVSQ